jgi:hypothetical protein
MNKMSDLYIKLNYDFRIIRVSHSFDLSNPSNFKINDISSLNSDFKGIRVSFSSDFFDFSNFKKTNMCGFPFDLLL